MVEYTLAIVKPDAISSQSTGKIIEMIEKDGFNIIRIIKGLLPRETAEQLYEIHKDKGFFKELIDFMTSGPVIIMVLEKENAVADWRALMGDTNPKNAAEGTIRKLFGTSVGENATHGSDAATTAVREIGMFFPELVKPREEQPKS